MPGAGAASAAARSSTTHPQPLAAPANAPAARAAARGGARALAGRLTLQRRAHFSPDIIYHDTLYCANDFAEAGFVRAALQQLAALATSPVFIYHAKSRPRRKFPDCHGPTWSIYS